MGFGLPQAFSLASLLLMLAVITLINQGSPGVAAGWRRTVAPAKPTRKVVT